MLSAYHTELPFTYRELRYMRSLGMKNVLRQHFPAVARLYHQLRQIDRKPIDVIFTAALGTSTLDGKLTGEYKPYAMLDLALALTTD